ncbi:cupin domain-containing protein [Variovorax boronicumulans]|uniref:cupin domain-containing protein n=1 Tax=Variovorax boronicumulans TaxID=436515 RepID=UPI00085C0769|nr:cupin domain-containing protein [Variovorax boronicumulans]OEZ27326.1 cupin [Variovorax boronicumulans]
MKNSHQSIRRVVTGHDAQGRSCIVEDGPALHVRTVESRPGFQATNIWCTTSAPASIDATDGLASLQGIAPPAHGTVLRIIDLPPESNDPDETRRRIQATFGNVFSDAQRDDAGTQKHPGMHRTATVDYALILQGEVFAVLDTEETLMRSGDVLVQRGTHHAWANRSDAVVRIAFVLIDGE